jgi:hypothetical protein
VLFWRHDGISSLFTFFFSGENFGGYMAEHLKACTYVLGALLVAFVE